MPEFISIIKKIKIFLSVFILLSLSFGILILVVRNPSYNIRTSGKLYILNKLSSSITVFDLQEGKEIKEIFIEIEPHEVTILRNPDRVIISNYGAPNVIGKGITVINGISNKIIKTIELKESLRPHGLITIAQSDKVGVVTDVGNDLLILNVKTGIIEKKISTKQEMSHLLVGHPKRPLVYVTNVNSNSLSVIDIEKEKVIKIIPSGLGTEGIDISPDGLEVWVTNSQENSIDIIDTETNRLVKSIDTGEEPLRLKFSVDGKYCLVTNALAGTISIYNRKSRSLLKLINIPGKQSRVERILYNTPRPVGIVMHPNGQYAFISNSNANKIEVLDMRTFTLVSEIKTGDIPDGIALRN